MGKVRELQNRISLPASASGGEFRELLGCKPSSISRRRALPTSKLCWRTILDKPCGDPVVDAADWLRGELGVSQSLWGEACLAIGREQAAIAIGIVSVKPAGHFRSTPGGYFHGMVAKAKAGELNLARTVWGLRQTAASGSRRGFSHPGSPSCV
jgi:Replication protein C C-terminal region